MEKNEKKKESVGNYISKVKNLKNYREKKEKVEKKPAYVTSTFKKYKKIADKEVSKTNPYVDDKYFNPIHTMKVLLGVFFIIVCIVATVIIVKENIERDSFHAISNIEDEYVTDKMKVLDENLKKIEDAKTENKLMSATNLNLINVYTQVLDSQDRRNRNNTGPTPTVLEVDSEEGEKLDKKNPMESAAGQVYTKLMNKQTTFESTLYSLGDIQPLTFIRRYDFGGSKIRGLYNPEDKTHIRDKTNSYYIGDFTEVEIVYRDGDGEIIGEFDSIKDIRRMASVYTYYHDPYDVDLFLDYCYNLYDNSITYKPEISDVYFCSGCMRTEDEELIASYSEVKQVTKYNDKLSEQPVKILDRKKTGIITRVDPRNYTVKDGNYEDFIDDILKEDRETYKYNYCPGHINLIIDVTALCFNDNNGLISIDTYGRKSRNWNKYWKGWNLVKKSNVIDLSNKDWEEEYGLSLSYTQKVNPLSQEEVNYYLNRLDANLSKDRYKVIEVALKSVNRIPYYYAGKPRTRGYAGNNFGERVKADYKGRVLSGLDCSGWVTWVYWTAFDKKLVKAEGTGKLATEGTKIRRYELKPGDLIIRPGYDSHVMMFLEWAEDGKMKVIHENGSINNVSVATVEGYYPYYRKIIQD